MLVCWLHRSMVQTLWGHIPEDMEEGGGWWSIHDVKEASLGFSAMEKVQGRASKSSIGRRMGGR